jgi:hypothetical protein
MKLIKGRIMNPIVVRINDPNDLVLIFKQNCARNKKCKPFTGIVLPPYFDDNTTPVCHYCGTKMKYSHARVYLRYKRWAPEDHTYSKAKKRKKKHAA